jgi:two-component system cell cycle sensor histidine kinase/response regulator CckA
MADLGQIEHALLNLAVNARDAMPRGGHLTIETENVVLSPHDAARIGDVSPGRYVRLAVLDNGCGMPPEVLSRIFEPFFTTKEVGKGTGLGLSTVFGIVKQSGGTITVESAEGAGSTFSILLPARAGPIGGGVEERRSSVPGLGAETILLVEDDDQVRSVVRRILRSRGYSVLEAHDAESARAVHAQNADSIDLILTDLVMPGTDGLAMAAELTQGRSGARVLYMSGHTEHAVIQGSALEPGVNFLQKPFSPSDLASTVRRALDAEVRLATPRHPR